VLPAWMIVEDLGSEVDRDHNITCESAETARGSKAIDGVCEGAFQRDTN
jgi:hypothetical protein